MGLVKLVEDKCNALKHTISQLILSNLRQSTHLFYQVNLPRYPNQTLNEPLTHAHQTLNAHGDGCLLGEGTLL